MPRRENPAPKFSLPSAAQSVPVLTWRVHLLRREPYRLPTLLAVLFIAAGCVFLMFHSLLPVLIALLLLVSAASEYLFPITYRLTADGAFASGTTSRLAVTWKEARRLFKERQGLVVTPLEHPSRLDAFRGVLLRFAPDGEPGDRASVTAFLAQAAPALLAASEAASPLAPSPDTAPTPSGVNG